VASQSSYFLISVQTLSKNRTDITLWYKDNVWCICRSVAKRIQYDVIIHWCLTGVTENSRPENAGRSEMHVRKLRYWKMRHQYAWVEMRYNRVWKACLRIRVPKLMLECSDVGLSSFDIVMSRGLTVAHLVFTLWVFGVSVFCCLCAWTSYYWEF